MFNKRSTMILLLVLLIALVFTGCSRGNKNNEVEEAEKLKEKKEIKIGCVDESEPMVEWLKEELEPQGYDVEVMMFGANQLPATSLKDGDIDGLIANQLYWVETFNKENDCDLHMMEPYIYFDPTKMLSNKYNSIDEIPADAKIAIPGDPSNMERALLGMDKAGLIKLGEKSGAFYSILDIEENERNIEFIETERGTTARIIDDVDAIICGSTEAKKTGIDINKFLTDDFDRYPHGLIVDGKDVDEEWVEKAMKYLQSQDFKDRFNEQYEGSYLLIEE